MANLHAIHSVGESIRRSLRVAYERATFDLKPPCDFTLLSSNQINELDQPGTQLSIYLHRVSVQETLRNATHLDQTGRIRPLPLTIDLHYLFTVWASDALHEQLILAWTMRQLHTLPILDASSLLPDADWDPDETVQLIPSELSTEDMMRIWDALDPPYHLSVSYVARVVRIDPDESVTGQPVVATRFAYQEIVR
jgi:hypothetical protein